jgi:urea transport system ATP-binding protein
MLTVCGLNQYYGQSHILRAVDFEARPGQCTCLMGRNGAGKTTFLQCLMGLLPIRSGRILLDGRDIAGLPPEARVRLGLGYVPQGRQIFPLLTVAENLRLPLPARRGSGPAVPEIVWELFPVLRSMLGRRGGDLSGGQQQQLALARALVLNPRVLILDEPAEGIQPNVAQDILAAVRRLAGEGLTVIQAEQKAAAARETGSAYAIMETGRIAARGLMEDLTDEIVLSRLSV